MSDGAHDSALTDGFNPVAVVDLSGRASEYAGRQPSTWQIVVGVAPDRSSDPVPDFVDVVLTADSDARTDWCRVGSVSGAVDAIEATCRRAPFAACVLAQLLRMGTWRTIDEAHTMESIAYAALQNAGEHRAWLTQNQGPGASGADDGDPILLEDDGQVLKVSLNRPELRNAYSARMRDALVEVFEPLVANNVARRVVLRGNGPAFCSGGDLSEFGTQADVMHAHAIRTMRTPGLLLHRLGTYGHVHVHGRCVGAGVELPAFAHHVVAAPDTTFRLPEVSMGLIPGAGGTASLPRRMGRRRTALLALSGLEIGVDDARRWGLVDEVR